MPADPVTAGPVLDRRGKILLAVALGLWALILGIIAARHLLSGRDHQVFSVFADAAERWWRGQPLYPAEAQFRYSPTFAALAAPLHLLSPRAGAVAWLIVNAAVLGGGLVAWVRTMAMPAPRAGTGALLVLCATPLLVGSLNNLQANPLVLGLMLLALAAVSVRRWNSAAVCLAAGTLLKIFPLAWALLLLVLYPRRLSWRLLLALAAGLLLPFLLQHPSYVLASYQQWFGALQADDRGAHAYRDAWALWEYWTRRPPNASMYLGLQLLTAGGLGLVALRLRWRVTPASPAAGPRERATLDLLWAVLVAWVMLFWPSTESSTYMLTGPVVAWLSVEHWRIHGDRRTGILVALAYWLDVLGQFVVVFPFGKAAQDTGIQPFSAVIMALAAWSWWQAAGRHAPPALTAVT